jgi:hypothetical protein
MEFFDYQECEWKEFELWYNGALIGRLLGFNYYIESEDKEMFGQGDEAFGISSGNISKSGSLKVYKSVLDAMQVAVKAAGGRWVTDGIATLIATYLPAQGRALMTDTLGNVKISKMPKGWEQGAGHMEMELPFKFLTLTTVP